MHQTVSCDNDFFFFHLLSRPEGLREVKNTPTCRLCSWLSDLRLGSLHNKRIPPRQETMEALRLPSRSGRNSLHDSRSSTTSFHYSTKRSESTFVPFDRLQSLQQSPTPPIYKDNRIWQRVIGTYYEELEKGGIVEPEIHKDLWAIEGPADLLTEIHALKSARMSKTWKESFDRLKKIIAGLNDFVTVATWATGMDGKVPAMVWGSIRLLLNVSGASF